MGIVISKESSSFLAFLFSTLPDGDSDGENLEDVGLLAFAILLLSAQTERASGRGNWLKALVAWFNLVDLWLTETNRGMSLDQRSEAGLGKPAVQAGLSICDLRSYNSSYWIALNRAILLNPIVPYPKQAAEDIRRLGERFELGVQMKAISDGGLFGTIDQRAEDEHKKREMNRVFKAVTRFSVKSR